MSIIILQVFLGWPRPPQRKNMARTVRARPEKTPLPSVTARKESRRGRIAARRESRVRKESRRGKNHGRGKNRGAERITRKENYPNSRLTLATISRKLNGCTR